MARGAVGEEDAPRLVPGGRQEAFAFGDELVGAADVAEVEEGLARVDGEVGFGHPGAPGGPVGAGVVEVLLGRGQGAQDRPAFAAAAVCGEGAGEAELEQAAGGGVLGAGQGVLEDAGGGGVVVPPGDLVGEVAQETGAHVVVPGGVGVVQAGDPVLAGVGVAARVEAVPGGGYLELPGNLAGESAV
ncbi:hypothetical protein [Streptomyces sp. DSM 15324]|uniref:hypothetical protein n=1 Tax=Streptomyces sp. DSM 15324 TaxID=1739111 RepID=UPI00131D0218|nr:hypothetical protein [Streptomyces sp. DSM 15324]